MNDLNPAPWWQSSSVITVWDSAWRVVSRSFDLTGDSQPPLQPIRLIDDDGQPLLNRRDGALLCWPRRVTLPAPQLTEYAREFGAATLTHDELTGRRVVGPGIARHAFSYTGWALVIDTWADLVSRAMVAMWLKQVIWETCPPITYTRWLPPVPDKPWRVYDPGQYVHTRMLL